MGTHIRDWLISLSCIIVTILVSIIPLGGGEGSPLFGYILDAGHFFFYALCASLISRFFPVPAVSANGRLVTTALTGSVLSATLEILQPSYGRTTSIGDFVASASGAFFGALWIYPVTSRLVRVVHVCAMFIVGGVCLRPAFLEWKSMLIQESIFPSLATFSDRRELGWWSGTPATLHEDGTAVIALAIPVQPSEFAATHPSLVVRVNRAPWHGAMLRLPPKSWSGYQTLSINLYADTATTLRIRIDDIHKCSIPEDRFSESLTIHSGWNQIKIDLNRIKMGPRQRELDLNQLKRLYLYTSPESEILYFRVGEIVLE